MTVRKGEAFQETRSNIMKNRRYKTPILQSSFLNGCGCLEDNKCNDPWHKRKYRLIIRGASDLEGWARFPWGASRVYRETTETLLWWVDADDRARVAYNGEPSAHPGAAKHNDAKARAATPNRVAAREAKRQAREVAQAIKSMKSAYARLCAESSAPQHTVANIPKLVALVGSNATTARRITRKAYAVLEEIRNNNKAA
tara:strand:+ start:2740 stop:3336 length:597 start_codon:yes stop_codon:yes gene_type:complete